MIWGTFSANGKAELVVIVGRQNAQKYVEVLKSNLLPFAEVHHGQGVIFQQDNASIHTAEVTKAWFEDKNVTLLDWPAKAPDLNPIENLWGFLSRHVYIQGRQFETKESLICCIKYNVGMIFHSLRPTNRGVITKFVECLIFISMAVVVTSIIYFLIKCEVKKY